MGRFGSSRACSNRKDVLQVTKPQIWTSNRKRVSQNFFRHGQLNSVQSVRCESGFSIKMTIPWPISTKKGLLVSSCEGAYYRLNLKSVYTGSDVNGPRKPPDKPVFQTQRSITRLCLCELGMLALEIIRAFSRCAFCLQKDVRCFDSLGSTLCELRSVHLLYCK